MASRLFARIVCGLLLALAPAAFAGAPSLLTSTGPAGYAPEKGFHSLGHPVAFNAKALRGLARGAETVVSLPNGREYPVVLDLVQDHGGGIASFVGHLRGTGNDYRVIVTNGPGGSFGTIHTPEGEFRLVPGDGGGDWLVDMTAEQAFHAPILLDSDMKRAPATKDLPVPGMPDAIVQVPGVNVPFLSKAAPTPAYGFDIMFVVTQGYANHLGSNLMTRLYQLVTTANTAYATSQVALTMRMVGVTVINYSDATSDGTALSSITPPCTSAIPSCGGTPFDAATFGAIETQRTANGADVVALMRDGSSFGGSGIAWVGTFNPANGATSPETLTTLVNPQYMYSVTTGCVLGCESVFIHEVGHNMGNQHDRATVSWEHGGNPSASSEQYAYGYWYCQSGTLTCNPFLAPSSGGCASNTQPECASPSTASNSNNFSEIMAYFQGSTNKNLAFSNPNIACTGVTGPGLACGTSGSVDAAGAMNERRAAISAIKGSATAPVGSPGALQFTAVSFAAPKSSGVANITVSRIGGSTGALTVNYATTDGTAVAGTDYTAKSGQLSWIDGDAANKPISVTLLNSAATAANKSFNVTLSNPTAGFLGIPTTSAVTILQPWPPGGTIPAGYTTVSGGAWTVSNTTSNDGDGVSLQSGTIPFDGTTPSTLQYTGNFASGNLTFAYKVNSYPGFGFFEFLIDGAVVTSDSGDSGWVNTSAPITAGSHTLQWRYRSALAFPCSSANPPPPLPQTTCLDKAWIDDVSLPLPNPGPFALNIALTGTGTGSVTSSPAGISCGAACSQTFAGGTSVTLTATPAAGSAFSGWSGSGCFGTSACTVSISAATSVTARFDTGTNIPRLFGISTRANVLTGNNVMIAGFIIGGSTPKTVVVRARGPSLGVTGALADPTLTLVPGDGSPPTTNDDWQSAANAAQLLATGFQPADPTESAIMATLNPGAYTAIVSGVGGGTGVGLVEVYEIDHPEATTVGISTRGLVQTGNNVMIGGFIIQGSAPQTVVVRARGPSLGVAGALADPTLTIVPADGSPSMTNDDWQSATNAAQLQATGFQPANAKESALLLTLNPGAYTAIVSGVGGATGVAIVEVYAQ